jgi:D-amino-acid dehydrogenase
MPDPWNAPGVHKHLAASLFNPYSPMKLRLRAVPSLIGWGLKFLRNSSVARYMHAARAGYTLAVYSIAETEKLREALELQYDVATVGTMKVFRDKAAMAAPMKLAEALADLGLRYEILDAKSTIAEEPQLAKVHDSIAGALRFHDDESGDALLFCQALAAHVKERGATIRQNTTVSRVLVEHGRITGVEIDGGRLPGRRVVLAAGNGSAKLAKTVRLSLPIRPVKGYSVTVFRNGLADWPRVPVIDDAMHAAVVPIGDRLRMVGTAEFTGFDKRIRQARIDNLFELLRGLYPHIAERIDPGKAETWAGLRPMSADGLPFIGPAGPTGLFINSGHGHLGWTHAVGSAKLLVDQILEQSPTIDPAPYLPAR